MVSILQREEIDKNSLKEQIESVFDNNYNVSLLVVFQDIENKVTRISRRSGYSSCITI